jgi:hypothetical protein
LLFYKKIFLFLGGKIMPRCNETILRRALETDRLLVGRRELAEFLGVSHRTIPRWQEKGMLPAPIWTAAGPERKKEIWLASQFKAHRFKGCPLKWTPKK